MNEHERAERAFREALRGAAEAEPFESLDPTALKPRSRWVTRWPALATAASVVIVAAVMLPSLLSGPGVMTASVPESAPADQAGAQAASRQAETAPEPAGLSEPAPGFRWESYRDVVVQIPREWGYGLSPGPDWCADTAVLPRQPYVDLDRGSRVVSALDCQGKLADRDQAMHLSFSPNGGPEPWQAGSPTWQEYRRTVGSAVITVVARDEDATLARQILDSAEVAPGGVDHNGCLTSLGTEPSGDSLAGDESDLVRVCLYDNADRSLVSSTVLTGPKATAAWEAILAAPAGGGPDGSAQECRPDDLGPVTVVLGLGAADSTMRFSGCVGNGLADASVEGGLRRITPELCRTLLVPPVTPFSGVGPAAAECLAATRTP